MKFLLDENIPVSIKKTLLANGYNVEHANQNLKGKKDREVFEYAVKNKQCIITYDIDFKEMKGYNTDGIGCIKAIGEVTSIKDKNIVVAGAGGASRAISFYLARENPQSIHILNRDINKAKSLAEDVKNSKLTDNVDFDSIDKIVGYVSDADILIDTTPVGMSPHVNDEAIVKAEDMHSDLVVNDIVYNPNETVLLSEAIKAGATPVYGIKMLLYQGAESFEIWTGEKAPVDVMEKTLRKTLDL